MCILWKMAEVPYSPSTERLCLLLVRPIFIVGSVYAGLDTDPANSVMGHQVQGLCMSTCLCCLALAYFSGVVFNCCNNGISYSSFLMARLTAKCLPYIAITEMPRMSMISKSKQ